MEFNLLSGAGIDNQLRLLYQILISESSYLGFSRSHETWGQGTLIRYTPMAEQNWPIDIIGDGATAQIYDDQHRLMNITTAGTTAVHVARFEYTDTDEFDTPQTNIDRLYYLTDGYGVSEGMVNIECIFINNKWINLRNIDPTYAFPLYNYNTQKKCKYYIMNFNKDISNFLEIDIIKEFEYPGLSTRVQLKSGPIGSMDATSADICPGCEDLERRINLNGEYLVSGITSGPGSFIEWIDTDPNAKNSAFFLIDTDGTLLVDGILFEETVVTNKEVAYIFSYNISNSTASSSETRKVRFKITTLSNINNKFSVFKESLPVKTHVSPVADNNPPGLPISYIRSQDIHESIFDVVGLHQLRQPDVWMAYEIPAPFDATNSIWQYFVDLEASIGIPSMLSLDTITVDEDVITGSSIQKMYAITQDLSLASRENFNLIMVSLMLDKETPTRDIYRQLFISWKPKYYSGNQFNDCTLPDYTNRNTFFDPDEHINNLGTVLYLANKMPIYRGYIDGTEQFKIIL